MTVPSEFVRVTESNQPENLAVDGTFRRSFTKYSHLVIRESLDIADWAPLHGVRWQLPL